MKQVKAFGPKDLRVVNAELPPLNKGEVVIDVYACGICGSDKWFWDVDSPSDYVAGHEVAGKVLKVGPEVQRLNVGDRVTVNNVKGCGTCNSCHKGEFVRCSNSVSHMGFGFSEAVIAPEVNCLVLDKRIGYEVGSLIFDNWGTPYSAIKRTSMKEGDIVVVAGCGPIGLAAIALAKQRKATIIAIDPIPNRLNAAKKLGASFALMPSEDISKVVEHYSESGVDIFIDCSGKAASYELAFSVLRIGGILLSIGEGAEFLLNSSELIHKHLTIIGSLYSTMQDGHEIQQLILDGEIDPLAFVTHSISLDHLPSFFGKVMTAEDGLLKAIVVKGSEE
ncbi:MAG: alcohol dehydrogenase catalytic domain-containing protein [Bacillaceae bacterium]|nr:alcohol dehydrogenase catalytic domain-containing protein [Bacillaceae bacterium]